MMKKFLFILAFVGLSLHFVGCTSSDSQSDNQSAAADSESADLEKVDSEKDENSEVDNSLASDQLPEDALGEVSANERNPAKGSKEVNAAETPGVDSAITVVDEPSAQNSVEAVSKMESPIEPPIEPTPIESSTTAQAAMSESTTVVDNAPTPKTAPTPLQKMATEPWQVGKVWYNTIYFARPGDTLKSISKMIYGSDKTSLLKKGNASLSSRKVKPGDKVYYNSPNRPDDSVKMLTYYEDNGQAPEVYVAKKGENLKKVAKTLLGYDNAWKELWASNSTESKGELSEGTELHYWKGQSNIAMKSTDVGKQIDSPALSEMPPPSIQDSSVVSGQAMADTGKMPQENIQGALPPPPQNSEPPHQDASAQLPPPPTTPTEAADQIGEQKLPPPPPVKAVNPPEETQAKNEETGTGGENQDTTNALLAVGVLAAGAAFLVIMRKRKKQKDLEKQALENTHVV